MHVSKTLRALVLSENPLVEKTDYRLSALTLVPQLERIDKDPVSPEESTEAQFRIKVKLRKIMLLSFSKTKDCGLDGCSDMCIIPGT